MPDLVTLHGDEESIETCSARIYEILEVASTGCGMYDEELANPGLTGVYKELQSRGFSDEEIWAGYADAAQTLKDRDTQLTYIDPARHA